MTFSTNYNHSQLVPIYSFSPPPLHPHVLRSPRGFLSYLYTFPILPADPQCDLHLRFLTISTAAISTENLQKIPQPPKKGNLLRNHLSSTITPANRFQSIPSHHPQFCKLRCVLYTCGMVMKFISSLPISLNPHHLSLVRKSPAFIAFCGNFQPFYTSTKFTYGFRLIPQFVFFPRGFQICTIFATI